MSTNVNELIAEIKELDLSETISSSYKPLVDLVNLFRMMIEDGGDFESTRDTLEAVRDYEVSTGGKMGQAASQYGSLINETAVDNQGKFDLALGKALMYLKDIVYLQPVLHDVHEILAGLIWLVDGHALIRAKSNFEKAGYNDRIFQQMDDDIMGVYNIVSSRHENECFGSAKYANAEITKDQLYEYVSARESDFDYLIKKYIPGKSFYVDFTTVNIRMTSERAAEAATLDKYSEKVSGLMDKLADIEITIAACELFFGKEKPIPSSNEGQQVIEQLKALVLVINDLSKHVLEIYDNFKKRGDDAPYCFMKKLPSIGKVSGYELGNLNSDDPIKTGTHFRDNYIKLAKSLCSYANEFKRGFGKVSF